MDCTFDIVQLRNAAVLDESLKYVRYVLNVLLSCSTFTDHGILITDRSAEILPELWFDLQILLQREYDTLISNCTMSKQLSLNTFGSGWRLVNVLSLILNNIAFFRSSKDPISSKYALRTILNYSLEFLSQQEHH